MRKFGPRPSDAPTDRPCPACHQKFQVGDYTTLISLGPGDDQEEQKRCREGQPYNVVAVEVHWICATGESPYAGS